MRMLCSSVPVLPEGQITFLHRSGGKGKKLEGQAGRSSACDMEQAVLLGRFSADLLSWHLSAINVSDSVAVRQSLLWVSVA